MPQERAYDFDALHLVAISNAGDDQSALLNSSESGRWPRSMTRTPRWRSSSGALKDGCAVDDWDAIA
jgi:hypothetical protein